VLINNIVSLDFILDSGAADVFREMRKQDFARVLVRAPIEEFTVAVLDCHWALGSAPTLGQ